MISVAMCTYNGDKYIKEQLESILSQSIKVNQIVICDDLSTDRTIEIIKEIQTKNDSIIEVYINRDRLGVTKNFEKALSLCKGDIIFLSDQDDIWRYDKVEKLTEIFNDNPECNLIFTDAELVNSKGEELECSLWKTIGTSKKDSYNVTDFLGKRFVTGATVAIRKKLLGKVLPIPKCWIHDAWLAINAATELEGVVACDEKLINYRQHEKNVIGATKRSFNKQIDYTLKHIQNSIDFRTEMKERFISFLELNGKELTSNEVENINRCIRFWQETEAIKEKNRFYGIKTILKNLINGNYNSYNHGKYGAAVDFFIMMRK